MNSKERILAAFRHEPVDRVPCSPHMGVGLINRLQPDEWQALREQTDVTMNAGGLGDVAIFGGQYYLDHSRRSTEGNVTTIEVETPKGMLVSTFEVTKESGGGSTTTEHMGKSDADIERLLSIPYEPPTFDVDAYHQWTRDLGDEGLVALGTCSPFRLLLGFFGPNVLYLRMADDPDLMERIVATMCERVEIYVDACMDKGVEHFWMGGSEHCGPGVVSPKYFERLVTPYDKRIVARIHERGGTQNMHMHGKLKAVCDDLIAINPDALSPVETGLRGDLTLAEAKARLGSHICVKGNLDDMAFLAIEPLEDVRAAALDALHQAAADGGYILSGTDAGIYSPEWVKAFLVMAEVAKAYPL